MNAVEVVARALWLTEPNAKWPEWSDGRPSALRARAESDAERVLEALVEWLRSRIWIVEDDVYLARGFSEAIKHLKEGL